MRNFLSRQGKRIQSRNCGVDAVPDATDPHHQAHRNAVIEWGKGAAPCEGWRIARLSRRSEAPGHAGKAAQGAVITSSQAMPGIAKKTSRACGNRKTTDIVMVIRVCESQRGSDACFLSGCGRRGCRPGRPTPALPTDRRDNRLQPATLFAATADFLRRGGEGQKSDTDNRVLFHRVPTRFITWHQTVGVSCGTAGINCGLEFERIPGAGPHTRS